ncbi:hypothetical protein BDF22DRAFT_701563 [Syncephalis plumigaleata]|nr:hypothetical protein BDF22DRAFT_701563 [Syncephalis plumigaleata]
MHFRASIFTAIGAGLSQLFSSNDHTSRSASNVDVQFHGIPLRTPTDFGVTVKKVLPSFQGASFAKGTYQQGQSKHKENVIIFCGTDATKYTTYRVFRSFEILPPPADQSIAEARRFFWSPSVAFNTNTGHRCYIVPTWIHCHDSLEHGLVGLTSNTNTAKKVLLQISQAVQYMWHMGWAYHRNISEGACLTSNKDVLFTSYRHTYSSNFIEFPPNDRRLEIAASNQKLWYSLAEYYTYTKKYHALPESFIQVVQREYAHLRLPPPADISYGRISNGTPFVDDVPPPPYQATSL